MRSLLGVPSPLRCWPAEKRLVLAANRPVQVMDELRAIAKATSGGAVKCGT